MIRPPFHHIVVSSSVARFLTGLPTGIGLFMTESSAAPPSPLVQAWSDPDDREFIDRWGCSLVVLRCGL
jgi:hypothetical protein